VSTRTVSTRADVDLLNGTNWLNDQIIAFFFEYLRQEAFADLKGDLLLLDPSSAFLLTAFSNDTSKPADSACFHVRRRQLSHLQDLQVVSIGAHEHRALGTDILQH
jgi:hypothetical protein